MIGPMGRCSACWCQSQVGITCESSGRRTAAAIAQFMFMFPLLLGAFLGDLGALLDASRESGDLPARLELLEQLVDSSRIDRLSNP